MCEIDFDGCADFYSETRPVARKPHRCVVCRKPIQPGTRYRRESYKWEGDVGSAVCCLRCEIDIRIFGNAHGGQYPFADSFVDYLVGCLDARDEESERVWRPMYERIQRRRADA